MSSTGPESGKHLLSIKLQSPSSTTNTTDATTTTTTTATAAATAAKNTINAVNAGNELSSKKNLPKISPQFNQEASFCMYLAAFSALLGAIGFGLGIGWSAPAFEQLSRNTSVPHLYEPRDLKLLTWISSSMPLSALFGALFSDLVVQKYGRRKALVGYGLPFAMGWLLIIASNNGYMFLLGRIILGLAIGALSGTAPSYIVDISTTKIRGTLGALFQLFIVTGILFAYVIGAFLPWRMASVVSITPTIIQTILIYFMPEGPNWLLQNKRNDEAKKALTRIRSSKSDVEKEFEILMKESNQTTTATSNNVEKKTDSKWKLYFHKKHLIPLFLSLGLMAFQQLCGVNAVMFYATAILNESGSTITPSLGTILIGLAQWIATFAGAIMVDFTGRRLLLIISGSIHVFSMFVFGIYYQMSTADFFGWIPVVSMIVFIIGFSIGWGPVPWLLVAEITPHESKSSTVAMSTCINWTLAFVVTKTFKELQELLTKHGVFYLFSALSAVSVLFAVFLLPETKNKSYEEIRTFFERRPSPTKETAGKFSIIDLTMKDSDTLTRSSDSA